jgi:hypothetical protein
MWASHLPPHVLGHSMSLLKLHLWCVWRSGIFLIYCHTTKTSGVRPVDKRDKAWNHLTQTNGLGRIVLKTDRHCNPNGVIHHPAATCGTAHCSNMMYHTTESILVVSIWCSMVGWHGSLSISVVMPIHWTVHKWHYLLEFSYMNLRQVLECIPFDIFPTRCNITQFIYFWTTLHVSGGISTHYCTTATGCLPNCSWQTYHHQELKTAHTAKGIRQTAAATCC